MSHSAEKCEREDPLRLFNIHSVAKYGKNGRGTLWRQCSKQVSQSRKSGAGKSHSAEQIGKVLQWFFKILFCNGF